MAGNVTGFQRPFTFRATEGYETVGIDQAVVYGNNMREVVVPSEDNLVPVGIVTYQYEDRDGATVSVQLDRIASAPAAEAIQYGEEVIVAAGGEIKPASSVGVGNVANILGEAQNTVSAGQLVQVLIRPRAKTV